MFRLTDVVHFGPFRAVPVILHFRNLIMFLLIIALY